MGSLTNMMGGTAMAVASTVGSADGHEDNIVTTVQASTQVNRVELYDLPNVQLDFLLPQDERFRNPGHRGTGSVPYDSIGHVDERRAVKMGEHEYDPVVQMRTPTGMCTATISNIEGFETRETGTIFTTAAHCLDIKDEQGNIVGKYSAENINFYGSYLDSAGNIQEFSMQGDEAWVNPLYQENIAADKEFFQENGYLHDYNLEADTAVIFSRQVHPNEVVPARVITTDFELATGIRDAVLNAQHDGEGVKVTVAGHAGDKPYLTTHENAEVVYGDYDGLNTKSDIAPGASGGSLFVSGGDDQPVALTENGEPIVIGVNSTVRVETDYSRHVYFNENTLKTAPFLKPEGTDSDEYCTQTGEVTASSLRIRVGPGVNFQELAISEGQENSQLPMGSKVTIHGTPRNELGQEWGLVSTPEGRTGYVSMNSDYVDQGPENCTPVADNTSVVPTP